MNDNLPAKQDQVAHDALTLLQNSGPEILYRNEERLEKTRTAVKAVLKEIQQDGMSAELDEHLNKMQVRIKEVISEMQDERMPLTRGLDAIKKAFTTLEADLDPAKPESLYSQLQAHRNAFAKEVAAEKKRKEEEARKKLEMEKEGNSVRSEVRRQVELYVLDLLKEHQDVLNGIFMDATLEDFDEMEDKVRNFDTAISAAEVDAFKLNFRPVYLDQNMVEAAAADDRRSVMDRMGAEYQQKMAALKMELMDKLPGRKQYLEEAEKARLAAEEAEKKAAEERAKAKAIQDEKEREEAEKRAEAAAEAARQKAADEARLKAEQEERDRIQREKDEKARLDREKFAVEQARNQRDLLDAQSSFNAQLEVVEVPESKAIESWEIKVKASQGWLHIINFYFMHKGKDEDPVDLEKRTLKQMKAFAERAYKKDGSLKIDSSLLEYEPTYTVQARK